MNQTRRGQEYPGHLPSATYLERRRSSDHLAQFMHIDNVGRVFARKDSRNTAEGDFVVEKRSDAGADNDIGVAVRLGAFVTWPGFGLG